METFGYPYRPTKTPGGVDPSRWVDPSIGIVFANAS